jgi:hypothetical protein
MRQGIGGRQIKEREAMAQDNSFDIVSKVEIQEVRNAIDQALKEIRQRFDLKDSHSEITLVEGDKEIQLASAGEYKLEAVKEILGQKLVKRGVSLKNMTYGKLEPAAGHRKGQRDCAPGQGLEKEGAGQHPGRYSQNIEQGPRRLAVDYRFAARQGSGRGIAVYQLPNELTTCGGAAFPKAPQADHHGRAVG